MLTTYNHLWKLQIKFVLVKVGLLGSARSLQRDLNRIAKTANTSGPKGFTNILQGNDVRDNDVSQILAIIIKSYTCSLLCQPKKGTTIY